MVSKGRDAKYIDLKAYAAYELSESLELIPALTYRHYTDSSDDSTTFDDGNGYKLNIALRAWL
ncbi:MAG: hypothetical protein KDD40_04365 [Bdellovibrionales bacterium]|nr:hypothetical protein [Bdellovibrionales bacterium]